MDDTIFRCANLAGEDNRNVGRQCLLLASLLHGVPGTTMDRLCGTDIDAFAVAARQIRMGKADLVLAGGVEGMSSAPFVTPKADQASSPNAEINDTTAGAS